MRKQEDHAENLVIAHRGLTSLHLENTLAALRSAFEHKADGVEFDVQLSKDLIPMVFHDRTLDRLVHIKACIDDLTLAELKNLRQSSVRYKNQVYAISTLQEILHFMPANKIINIELKETTGMKGLEGMKSVLKVIEPFKNKLKIIISSFEPEILHMVSQLDHDYMKGLLIDTKSMLNNYLKSSLIDHIDFLHPHIDLIDKPMSEEIKKRGIKLILWGHKNLGEELIAKLRAC